MPQLLNNVLREEWGFRGMVLTDYFGVYGYQNADQEIRNGNDIMLVSYDSGSNNVQDQKSATSVKAMRQACKNIMYTVVNSRAYAPENYKTGPQPWQIAFIGTDVVLAAVLIGLELVTLRRYKKRKEEASVSVENRTI